MGECRRYQTGRETRRGKEVGKGRAQAGQRGVRGVRGETQGTAKGGPLGLGGGKGEKRQNGTWEGNGEGGGDRQKKGGVKGRRRRAEVSGGKGGWKEGGGEGEGRRGEGRNKNNTNSQIVGGKGQVEGLGGSQLGEWYRWPASRGRIGRCTGPGGSEEKIMEKRGRGEKKGGRKEWGNIHKDTSDTSIKWKKLLKSLHRLARLSRGWLEPSNCLAANGSGKLKWFPAVNKKTIGNQST